MAQAYPSFTETVHHDVYPAIDPSQPALKATGKVVLITGGGSGIGKAIGLAFAQAHARGVALLGRTRSTLEEAAAEITKMSDGHTKPFVVEADVTSLEQVQRAMDATTQFYEGHVPDVVVNNAGAMNGMGPLQDLEIDGFMASMELNVRGSLNLMQTFLRAAAAVDGDEEGKVERTVINIPTGGASLPFVPGGAGYVVPKLAGAKLTEYLHWERPAWRVFNMQPGVVMTELARRAGRNAMDTPELPGGLAVWLTIHPDAAAHLNGRFIWANWDVDEMLARKEEIDKRGLLTLGVRGYAEGFSGEEMVEKARQVRRNATR